MSESYRCGKCGETYEREWSDEEAMNESTELFGDLPASDLAIVCDDCFKAMSPMWEADDD